jgi:hypothetical protein
MIGAFEGKEIDMKKTFETLQRHLGTYLHSLVLTKRHILLHLLLICGCKGRGENASEISRD